MKYNDSDDRLNQCRLASGYFIVNEGGLFTQINGTDLEQDFGVKYEVKKEKKSEDSAK